MRKKRKKVAATRVEGKAFGDEGRLHSSIGNKYNIAQLNVHLEN